MLINSVIENRRTRTQVSDLNSIVRTIRRPRVVEVSRQKFELRLALLQLLSAPAEDRVSALCELQKFLSAASKRES